MILVTGSEGFIGSHLVRALPFGQIHSDPRCHVRLGTAEEIMRDNGGEIEAVFHLGAISDTTCEDAKALAETNVRLSAKLAHFTAANKIPFVYASSASIYGNGAGPLNKYAWSKWDFDDWMQDDGAERPRHWYGLRFFNVYGPGEDHKGKQASMVHQLLKEMREKNTASIFDIEAKRDFVHVDDVVNVMLWMWRNRPPSGIYDVGTGVARDFEDIIHAAPIHGTHLLERISMPPGLAGKYQFHTKADLTKLRAAGYTKPFLSLEEGIAKMCEAEKAAA